MNKLVLRGLEPDDVSTVVDIHLCSFPGFFLSFLGSSVLKQYYLSIIDFGQIGIAGLLNGRLLGFVVGIENDYGFYRKLLCRRGPRFILAIVPALLRRPTIIFRLLSALRRRTDAHGVEPGSVTLTSIAVLPNVQSKGVGHKLIIAFREEVIRRGFNRIFLETDADQNDAVNQFYLREGYKLHKVYFTPHGRKMNEYTLDI